MRIPFKRLNIVIPCGFQLKIILHWSCLVLPAVTLLLSLTLSCFGDVGNWLEFWLCLFVTILLHELGHWGAARLLQSPADKIVFFCLGGFTHGLGMRRLLERGPLWRRGIVLSAGCLGNLLIAALSLAIILQFPWWACYGHRSDSIFMRLFELNLSIGLFNLAPLYPLDGGRLLIIFLEWVRIPAKVQRLAVAHISCLSGVGLLGVAVWLKDVVFGLVVVLCIVIAIWLCRESGEENPARRNA